MDSTDSMDSMGSMDSMNSMESMWGAGRLFLEKVELLRAAAVPPRRRIVPWRVKI